MNITIGNTVTMTSLELVDFINTHEGLGILRDLTHANFMAKVPKVLRVKDLIQFQAIYQDSYGRNQPMYRFPKREACLMAMSYSYELQAKVFDKMTALESAPALNPANFSRLQLIELAMQAEQERLILEEVVAVQTPQVQAFQLIAGAEGSMCFTDAAKTLQIRPKDLTLWLSANKWIYKRVGSDSWLGYQARVQANLIEHKTLTVERSDGTAKVVTHARITPKGLSKLAMVFKEAA